MNLIRLFTNIIFPHLWLNHSIEPATMTAIGSLLGGVGAVGSLFGGGGDEGPSINDTLYGGAIAKSNLLGGVPLFGIPGADVGTPTSSLDVGTGQVNIDPTARGLTLDSYNTFAGNLGQTRESLLGNEGAFINARVAPLMERLAAGRGALDRGLSRTNVRGTFRDRGLQDFDINASRAEGDARAIAQQETLNAVNAIDQLLFNAGTGTGTNIFNQELKALGLGEKAIFDINNLANTAAGSAAAVAADSAGIAQLADQARTENIAGFIGTGLSAYSDWAASQTGNTGGNTVNYAPVEDRSF